MPISPYRKFKGEARSMSKDSRKFKAKINLK